MKFFYFGFTLLELMIVIAIISILTIIGIPSYKTYVQEARFTEVITSVDIYKTAITLALQQSIPIAELSNGQHNIPAKFTPTKNIANITVENGVITALGSALVANASYILEPNQDGTHWNISGSCLKIGLCHE